MGNFVVGYLVVAADVLGADNPVDLKQAGLEIKLHLLAAKNTKRLIGQHLDNRRGNAQGQFFVPADAPIGVRGISAADLNRIFGCCALGQTSDAGVAESFLKLRACLAPYPSG